MAIHTFLWPRVYDRRMRRINVHVDDELDRELAREAALRGQSKAALIRQAAQDLLDRRTAEPDPWAEFTGMVTDVVVDDRHHDDIIYR